MGRGMAGRRRDTRSGVLAEVQATAMPLAGVHKQYSAHRACFAQARYQLIVQVSPEWRSASRSPSPRFAAAVSSCSAISSS